MQAPPDGVDDALLSDLDPEAVLERDSRVLFDPRFLTPTHAQLLAEADAASAHRYLYRLGFLHGLQDAVRAEGTLSRREPGVPPPLSMRYRTVPAGAAVEIHGDWPEAREAAGRLSDAQTRQAPACALSAGYTAGWLSALFDADLVVVETGCRARGDTSCSFVAREAASCRPEEPGALHSDAVPFDAFRALVQAREVRRGMLATAGLEPPTGHDRGLDHDAACVHIWGPVMVLPFSGADEGLRALELIGRDPAAAEVSVVIVHLAHAMVDEAFGAAALEQIVQQAEAWGAETLFAEPGALCEAVLADLSHPPLLILKDLEEAVVAAFQIARSQRRVC